MDYRATLNLPQTDFKMKANMSQREPEVLKAWEESDLYAKVQEQTAGRPLYILHDGPPYANGHIHMGHALNKILKDIILKAKRMAGFHCPYVPGWDCHGLPIELNVDKDLGPKKRRSASSPSGAPVGITPGNGSRNRRMSSSGSGCWATGKIPI